jgi:uncharacterized C2H2 Zn-finger protein
MLIIPISDGGRIEKRLIENKQFLKLTDLEGVFDMLTSNHINIKHLYRFKQGNRISKVYQERTQEIVVPSSAFKFDTV